MNRLKELRDEKGLTQADLAEIVGINSPQSVGYYETGKRDMSTTCLMQLAEFFGVTTDYLLGIEKYESKIDDSSNNCLYVPVVGNVTAGNPILATENIQKFLPISSEMFAFDKSDTLFFLKVNGESMNKIIPNESYVLVKKQNIAENNDIVVAITNEDNEATLKRYKIIDSYFVMLEPESNNDNFKSIVINGKSKDFRILGKVIGSYKEW